MDCITTKLNEKDQFIPKIKNSDSTLAKYYHFDAMDKKHYEERLFSESNGRETALADIIERYMSDLSLDNQQVENLKALSDGAKVVIGGQQAGLFGGPLYTFHKIFSIITLSEKLSNDYDTHVVPVFWIAGEDHDFEEINHTYVFNEQKAKLQKIKYSTMTPPESSVSKYTPDKAELHKALNQFFKELKETSSSKQLLNMCRNIIDNYDGWTDMFKALLHEVFKAYGVLLIDADYKALRQLEQPLFKKMIENHQDVDDAFRQTQAQTIDSGLEQMIQTDTNVHLFIHEDNMRQLLTVKDGQFYLNKSEKVLSKQAVLDIVEKEPERFSNNVVTRPIMEEWLFNTVAFVGGPSEIKYWTELSEAFRILEVSMPIVLPRLRITYLNTRIEKLLDQYHLDKNNIIEKGVTEDKDKFIRAQASQSFIDQIKSLSEQQKSIYQSLQTEVKGNHDNEVLLSKNNEIHQNQFDYLLKRYLLNIERENDISMKHFEELSETLHPMGGLQERIWNPLQIMNDFGIDVFSPSTYPPLSYTFDHILIKP
ncbi:MULTISPECIES: bacillithiol biosynthesis cysteine-adding enzyme BshC [Staphylococcus]|jgi:bacillithiol biosynthesis cysteine-adding enzyme BshC|uniref:bacillithiol biosynthesis cysteine-adding enzyme BshC n=1 Tax=Staphylococcus TaxID=1279 RepID=UPI000DFCD814|nr:MULTISPECIES: bacillithiol biosynthesis cysteine-adding enzyme BshC [Staphylococcus]MBO1204666.1 bacillithiol biosynthesis cysteine-adding enzyme BshC [Staphylococcus nepalensis]MCD8890919.1 bacillithiol biosynthesis cysteine-adding enzyme BshC [Staphylococcus nepalensis]MDR5648421.1 bacillithiol biosynthesis cysteine-adding enzyme BshC [Staphylococcus nepalensis]MDW8551350.1 bacillithiol biosynthesis cysteine-adding enzyme BshC [Staphylococcus nepalensis]RIO42964.1 bacillithiol biosynthesi